jgi:hypothetical protein
MRDEGKLPDAFVCGPCEYSLGGDPGAAWYAKTCKSPPSPSPSNPPGQRNSHPSSPNVCDPNLVKAYRRQVANCDERKKIEDKNCDDAKKTAKENPDYTNQMIAICVSGQTVTKSCYAQITGYPAGIDKCP